MLEQRTASRTLAPPQSLAAGLRNTIAISPDASNIAALEHAVAQHDLVVSLIPYSYHAAVIKAAIKSKTHVVTTSYVNPAMRGWTPLHAKLHCCLQRNRRRPRGRPRGRPPLCDQGHRRDALKGREDQRILLVLRRPSPRPRTARSGTGSRGPRAARCKLTSTQRSSFRMGR